MYGCNKDDHDCDGEDTDLVIDDFVRKVLHKILHLAQELEP